MSKRSPDLSRERLYYAAGPGDVVGTYRHWRKGQEDPRQFARTYSAQFFDLVEARDAEGWVVSSGGSRDYEETRNHRVENRPLPKGGWLIRQLVAAWRLTCDLVRYRPDAAIVAEGTTLWSFLLPLRFLGVRVVPTIHCVMRRENAGSLRRLFEKIESWSLSVVADQSLCASAEIAAQLPAGQESVDFLPTYQEKRLEAIPAPREDRKEFRVLYVGRVEEDKGLFDLLDAIVLLHGQGESLPTVRLDVCGEGGALESFRSRLERTGFDRFVSLKGHCSVDELRHCLGSSHAVVVPTTSRFVEGFNQVIVEGVLACRPVIATTVCPSASLFESPAVERIAPDDPVVLAETIRSLAGDPDRYRKAVEAASVAARRSEFFCSLHSWGTRCGTLLDSPVRCAGFSQPITEELS